MLEAFVQCLGCNGHVYLEFDLRFYYWGAFGVANREGDFFHYPVDFGCSEVQSGKCLTESEAVFLATDVVSKMGHSAGRDFREGRAGVFESRDLAHVAVSAEENDARLLGLRNQGQEALA